MHRGYLAALIMLLAAGASLAAEDWDKKMAACERLADNAKKISCLEAVREELLAERARIEAELRRRGHEPGAPPCTIEDWRYSQWPDGRHIKIEGRTTCRTGQLSLSLYDADGNYIGSEITYIRGYVFDTFVEGQAPTKLRIKYDVDTR